jgi:hypothetical protein
MTADIVGRGKRLLTWLIRHILYRNIQFLNHVIIIEIKILLPQELVTSAEFLVAQENQRT